MRLHTKHALLAAAFIVAHCIAAHGQALLAPMPIQQFLDSNGKPLAGGLIFTFSSGTLTPLDTFTDFTGNTTNTNPIQLDSSGFPSNGTARVAIFLQAGPLYRIRVSNSVGVQQYQIDGISGIQGSAASAISAATTVAYVATPIFTALAQQQLFRMTLTGNVSSSTLVMTGISAPAIITFQWTQDGTGNRTVLYPVSVVGEDAVNLAPNAITQQSFLWDGTHAVAIATAQVSNNNIGLPGEVKLYSGFSAPAGWLACDGSAVSRVTYANLFSVVAISTTGNTHTNTTLDGISSTTGMDVGMPISGTNIPASTTIASITNATSLVLSQAATGTSSGGGVVVAPFGVGDGATTFNLPDLRGRSPIGTGTGSGLTKRVAGVKLGEETHTQSVAELPAHTHTPTFAEGAPTTVSGSSLGAGEVRLQTGANNVWIRASDTLTIGNTGSGTAFNVMQPSIGFNYIVKF